MRIFVTGATGVVGRRAVPLLLRAGHRVSVAGRSPDRLRPLETLGATPLVLDLFDRTAVTRAIAGHDMVINLATHVPGTGLRQFLRSSWKEMDHIRRDGSAILVDAALAAGVQRFVQESFAPIYPDCGDRWIHEDVPLQPVAYNRTVLDAERSLERFAHAGGTGVVLRFAFFYGANDPFTADVLKSVRHGWLPLFGPPDAYFSMVNHEDAASAVVAALAAPSGTYNVVDDEPLTHRQLGDVIAELSGVRSPRLPPRWITGLTGGLGRMIARSLRISNARLKSATEWTPTHATARAGWSAILHLDEAFGE